MNLQLRDLSRVLQIGNTVLKELTNRRRGKTKITPTLWVQCKVDLCIVPFITALEKASWGRNISAEPSGLESHPGRQRRNCIKKAWHLCKYGDPGVIIFASLWQMIFNQKQKKKSFKIGSQRESPLSHMYYISFILRHILSNILTCVKSGWIIYSLIINLQF